MTRSKPDPYAGANESARLFGYSHHVVWKAVVWLAFNDWLRARRRQG